MSINSSQGYNLDNFEAMFREFLILDGVSPLTLKNYQSDLRHFLGWFHLFLKSNRPDNPENNSLSESDFAAQIDHGAVSSYKTYLETNGLPPKTINRRLSTLRKFCSLCIKQGWMKENPAKRIGNVSLESGTGSPPVFVAVEDTAAPAETEAPAAIEAVFEEYRAHLASEHISDTESSLIMEDLHEFSRVISS
jgi:hypothetical protein